MFSLSISIGNSICAELKKDGTVSPDFMCQGVFATHAGDNIDHGTAISSTQYLNLIL